MQNSHTIESHTIESDGIFVGSQEKISGVNCDRVKFVKLTSSKENAFLIAEECCELNCHDRSTMRNQ